VELKLQVVAIVASTSLVTIVFELLRRRRLGERYALLWLFSSLVLLVLSIWTGLLEIIARAVGIIYPPNALFMIAFAFVLILMLHFSLAISRLSEETKVLAQEIARLDKGLSHLNEADEAYEAHDEARVVAVAASRASTLRTDAMRPISPSETSERPH
jgi:hypothetical protein